MKRVFLDANVLWSAARKPTALPWQLITSKAAQFLTSNYALAEARRNLPPEDLGNLAALTRDIEIVPDAFGAAPAGVVLPAKDLPILATAALAGADLLCTGDHDFAQYFGRTIGGVKIILPRMLAGELTLTPRE